MARYIDKNIVKANLAKKVEIQLAYVIGEEKPVSIYINTFNTSIIEESEIIKAIEKLCDLTPGGIIRNIDLFNVEYTPLSSYGHFGRKDLNLSWEKTDLSEKLKDFFSIKNTIK
jgi:S-adenosylmethionine synthetase